MRQQEETHHGEESDIYAPWHRVGFAHVLLSIIDDFLIDLMTPNVWRENRHLTTMIVSLRAFNNLSAYQSSRFT